MHGVQHCVQHLLGADRPHVDTNWEFETISTVCAIVDCLHGADILPTGPRHRVNMGASPGRGATAI